MPKSGGGLFTGIEPLRPQKTRLDGGLEGGYPARRRVAARHHRRRQPIQQVHRRRPAVGETGTVDRPRLSIPKRRHKPQRPIFGTDPTGPVKHLVLPTQGPGGQGWFRSRGWHAGGASGGHRVHGGPPATGIEGFFTRSTLAGLDLDAAGAGGGFAGGGAYCGPSGEVEPHHPGTILIFNYFLVAARHFRIPRSPPAMTCRGQGGSAVRTIVAR